MSNTLEARYLIKMSASIWIFITFHLFPNEHGMKAFQIMHCKFWNEISLPKRFSKRYYVSETLLETKFLYRNVFCNKISFQKLCLTLSRPENVSEYLDGFVARIYPVSVWQNRIWSAKTYVWSSSILWQSFGSGFTKSREQINVNFYIR